MKLPKLITGRLERRYKRFLCDVELDHGETVTAHCANPGSMKNCAPAGARVWLSQSDNPKRKLRYSWELVRVDDANICINTHRANQLVAEALGKNAIEELKGYSEARPEVRISDKSRIDFELREGDDRCYVEVKSVTMGVGKGVSEFPDSVTTRGTKHLEELMTLGDSGSRPVLFFLALRDDTRCVRPAESIDPVYAQTLRRAVKAGVEVIAYGTRITEHDIELTSRIDVDLE